MRKTVSNDYPIIQNLQGKILVPTGIQQLTDEEGLDYYEYYLYYYPQMPRLADDEYYAMANKELAKKTQMDTLSEGCPTSLGFKIDCMPNNVADFAQTLAFIDSTPQESGSVVVRDYDNVCHTVTVDEFRAICKELGAFVMSVRQEYWASIDSFSLK